MTRPRKRKRLLAALVAAPSTATAARRAAAAAVRERVRQAWSATGMSQKALARLLKTDQATVNLWLSDAGDTAPSAGWLTALTKALRVSGHWLLTGEGSKTAPDEPADVRDARHHGFQSALNIVLGIQLRVVETVKAMRDDMEGPATTAPAPRRRARRKA